MVAKSMERGGKSKDKTNSMMTNKSTSQSDDLTMEEAAKDEETVIEIDMNREKGIESWNKLEKKWTDSVMVT